jgi:hypothetical protein
VACTTGSTSNFIDCAITRPERAAMNRFTRFPAFRLRATRFGAAGRGVAPGSERPSGEGGSAAAHHAMALTNGESFHNPAIRSVDSRLGQS